MKTVKHQFTEMIKKEGIYTDKNSSFVQQNFINKLTILLNEINSMKENKNFMSIWYNACKKGNIYYSRILYLLKVLNCQLDIKNVVTNNLALASNDNFRKDKYFKDWNVLSDVDSSQFQSINPMNYSIKENKDDKIAKFCHELNLNSGESIVKLIPVNCFFTNFSRNFFVSISDEGVVRLHIIENEINFKDIYTIKNRVQYKIKLEDNILKADNISHVESRKKIIIIIAIKYKLEVITFELNEEKYDVNIDDVLVISDDLDLSIGNYKLKSKGSCGGHNGLRDIESKIGTTEYKRLKIGISNDKDKDTKDYVLGNLSKDDKRTIDNLYKDLCPVIDDYFKLEFTELMNKYNHKNR